MRIKYTQSVRVTVKKKAILLLKRVSKIDNKLIFKATLVHPSCAHITDQGKSALFVYACKKTVQVSEHGTDNEYVQSNKERFYQQDVITD